MLHVMIDAFEGTNLVETEDKLAKEIIKAMKKLNIEGRVDASEPKRWKT